MKTRPGRLARWRRISNSVAVRPIRRLPRWTRRRSRSMTQVAVPDDPAARGVGEVAVGPTQQRADPAHQLAQRERLRDVVVRAELQADHLVELVAPRRQEQDRRLGADRAEAAQHLEPVDARQPDVEDDEVGRLGRRELEALLAAPRDRDLVPLLLEGVLDASRDGELVFDDQDGGHGAAESTPRPLSGRRAGGGAPCGSLPSRHRGRPCASPRPGDPAPPKRARACGPTQHSEEPIHMPDRPRLAAASRTVIGKQVARLRRDGLLPGGRLRPRRRQRERLRRRPRLRPAPPPRRRVHPRRPVGRRRKARPVLSPRSRSTPISRRPIHVDLFAVRMTEELTVEVQLVGTGTAPAIELGGTLSTRLGSVKVRALPDNLPETLHYDLSPLVDYDTIDHRRGHRRPGGRDDPGRCLTMSSPGCSRRGSRSRRRRRARPPRARPPRARPPRVARPPSGDGQAEGVVRGPAGSVRPPAPVAYAIGNRIRRPSAGIARSVRAAPARRPRASRRPSSRTGPRRRTRRGTRRTTPA